MLSSIPCWFFYESSGMAFMLSVHVSIWQEFAGGKGFILKGNSLFIICAGAVDYAHTCGSGLGFERFCLKVLFIY